MIMTFLVGKKGIEIGDYCDTRAVIKRHKEGQDNNTAIMNNLKQQLFSKSEKSRTLYYILLTDGYFPPDSNVDTPSPSSDVYFPGHVFILEKIWDETEKKHYFYFYQSYINQYTLKQHIELNNGLKISLEKAKNLIDNLEYILNNDEWDEDNIRKWGKMTFTNSSKFNNTNSQGKFFLCFRKARSNSCYNNLLAYLTKVLKYINKLPPELNDEIYGDKSLYDSDSTPLTNMQMKQQVLSLMSKIYINKKKS
jgi:hypothetical protein